MRWGGSQDGDPSHPSPPQEADSPQKQADLVKTAISHMTVGDVGGHVTNADSGANTLYGSRYIQLPVH